MAAYGEFMGMQTAGFAGLRQGAIVHRLSPAARALSPAVTSTLTSPMVRSWRAPSGLCGLFGDLFPGRSPGLRWGAPLVLRRRSAAQRRRTKDDSSATEAGGASTFGDTRRQDLGLKMGVADGALHGWR